MYVYDWLAAMAGTADALSLEVDLPGKCLRYKSEPVIEGGKLAAPEVRMRDGTATLAGIMAFDGDAYAEMQRLYKQFKRSVPGKHERLNKGCFKAYASDALSYEELRDNMPRQQARLLLEGFILCGVSAGIIPWENPAHFFWQGADKDFIVYRDWII